MDTPIEKILRNLGIPLECCPCCEMTNWEFHGAVGRGIYTVTCQTCGRRYERMTRREQLVFLARGFTRAIEGGTEEEANLWYGWIVNHWNTPGCFTGEIASLVCTSEGFYDDANHDIDF